MDLDRISSFIRLLGRGPYDGKKLLHIGPIVESIYAFEAIMFSYPDGFKTLAKIFDGRDFLFVHHFDQVDESNESSLSGRTQVIKTDSNSYNDFFLQELEKYDPISMNFNFGLVSCLDVGWVGLCLLESDIGLIFSRKERLSAQGQTEFSEIALSRDVALERANCSLRLPNDFTDLLANDR
jgi:hypothetical protein